MDKNTKMSLLKRAGVCFALVLLYGLFGTWLHAGSATRDATAPASVVTKGQQAR